jgi:hypothetical protein
LDAAPGAAAWQLLRAWVRRLRSGQPLSPRPCPPPAALLLQDLHHPAMRDRHWRMLMQTTGKQFVMDERFCLGDLLALELHNYVDACSEIVDRCVLVRLSRCMVCVCVCVCW